MANIVKQIAIFNKDQNSGMGSWETKDIGALASNITLATPIGEDSNVEDVLHHVLPNNGLSSGFIEATEGGQLKTSNMSDDINGFFENTEDGGLNTIVSDISALQTELNTKVNSSALNGLIEQWVLDNMGGDDASIVPGLKAEQISNLVYPIGSIFTSFSSQNPSEFLGGSWEQITDKFLLATSSDAANLSNQTGGAKSISYTPIITLTRSTNVAITAHTYTPAGSISDNIAACFNELKGQGTVSSGSFKNRMIVTDGPSTNPSFTFKGTKASLSHSITQPDFKATGTAATIATMPPYVTVYMWKRTALAPANNYYVVGSEEVANKILVDIEQETLIDALLSESTIRKWQEILENNS